MHPPKPERATVIIVGLGLGGLALAIECHRAGHRVIAIDQQKELKPLGDSIGIPHNAQRVIRRWGDGAVHEELQTLVNKPGLMQIRDGSGELFLSSNFRGYSEHGYLCHRGELVETFYKHALSLGIEFKFGHRVLEYFEDEDQAGVVIEGERLTADCVIGADGVHSKARGQIIGTDPTPHSSGYAMYRAWFDGQSVRDDPETRWLMEGTEDADKSLVYIGPDVHVMLGTAKGGKEVFWMCTHKDTYEVTESWHAPGSVDEMIKYIKDWPVKSEIEKIARKTPGTNLIDFKLLWRDPLETWVSPKGRMMIIGDAAHPFLPTSGQGAAQAIEDAATLSACLDLAGKPRIKEALAATMAIRYDRATITQRMGIETRNKWHKTDFDLARKRPEILAMPQPHWIFNHDCRKYAYDEFENVVETLKKGEKYRAKNLSSEDPKDPLFIGKEFVPEPWVG